MIDCAGNAPATVANVDAVGARDARMASIFSVGLSQGEPSLLCTYLDATTNTWMSSPIVQGVENFQVLYGVDGVTANTLTPSPTAAAPNVPNAYLRADEMAVPGNAAATNVNWRRVRSLRIGMVLRSAKGAAQDAQAQTFYPFGPAKSSDTGLRRQRLCKQRGPANRLPAHPRRAAAAGDDLHDPPAQRTGVLT
jgi:type IV pilus assembly protein PilW